MHTIGFTRLYRLQDTFLILNYMLDFIDYLSCRVYG